MHFSFVGGGGRGGVKISEKSLPGGGSEIFILVGRGVN